MTPAERARQSIADITLKGIKGGIGSDQMNEATDALNGLSREILIPALDFADAVGAALNEDHSALSWAKCVKAHAAFNAALLRALPGGE